MILINQRIKILPEQEDITNIDGSSILPRGSKVSENEITNSSLRFESELNKPIPGTTVMLVELVYHNKVWETE